MRAKEKSSLDKTVIAGKKTFAHRRYQNGAFFWTAAVFTLLTFSLAIYPQQGLDAAKHGLMIFWEIVFPSLLPFFVLSEILLGLGVVSFIGVFLEPLMRPVFNVPGEGAFALSMGLAAGYPMDAVITGRFRRSQLCSRVEAERLLAFTNTADPLFMFGAVAVGMFGHAELGVVIAVAHYLAAFSVGFLFRFYGREKREKRTGGAYGFSENRGGSALSLKERESALEDMDVKRGAFKSGLIYRALQEMRKAKEMDGRPLGRLVGEAVKDSVSTLFMIGGFIMVFSVVVQIMEETGVNRALLPMVGGVLRVFGLDPNLSCSVLKGLLEIDLGAMAAAEAVAPLGHRLVVVGAIIGWSGLSVHGQVISVIHETDIRIAPYIIARLLHAFLAGLYTRLLNGTLKAVGWRVSPGFFFGPEKVITRWRLSGRQFILALSFLLVGSILLNLAGKYRLLYQKSSKSPKNKS